MSISSEISRLSRNVSDALTAISQKGVTVPSGSNSDDLANLISQISGGGTAAISVVDTTDTAGGTIRTITARDISDTTAIASDVASGKYFYTAAGVKTAGTASGGGTPSATAHTIYFEFSDSTNTSITGYWDDSFISSAITATTPTTYNNKTVTLAQLDNVTWYEPSNIPIGVQLIDFTKVTADYVINSNGQVVAEQWYSVSDYTPIASGMTFTFKGCRWFYAAFFDSSKNLITQFYIYNYTTELDNPNFGVGTLGSGIPSNAAYIRITGGYQSDDTELSLIRTA